MTSLIGRTLAHYRITAAIGAGGMGEVYRATDTKLGRDVALKILPDAFAHDADRLARFRREAQVLASLNHSDIAQIYGLEEADGRHALVMELVEGPTLADRIAQGPLPVDEAIAIARRIAGALEAAHEQGIIHRDLKPANIKVREDGTVKVLDFGLAKALDPAGPSRSTSDSTSPTLTSPAMTAMGVILGTAAYMAPEQARGRPVDKRADIWAFGVVLFEMLTASRLFAGDSITDVLAGVITRDPDWTRLPASTPPAVRRLLSRCLERDPKRRLRDIGDAGADLDDRSTDAPVSRRAPVSTFARALPWGLFVAAALVSIWSLWPRPDDGPLREAINFDLGLPAGVEPDVMSPGGAAISPDGRSVAVVGVTRGVRHCFVRRIDGPGFVEVAGSSGANSVTFSPDSRSLAFMSTGSTLTVASLVDQQRRQVASGGQVTVGVAWSEAGIVFGRSRTLWIVSPDGGQPRALTTLDETRGEILQEHPLVTPNGRFLLFASETAERGGERIEALPLGGGARHVVVERATTPVWSPSGHLLFARDGAVWAAPFDQRTATLTGEAAPVVPRGTIEPGALDELGLWLSPAGTLLYLPQGFFDQRVVSVARDGAALELGLPAGRYTNPRLSPDGRQLLVESRDSALEVLDLARGTHARLTAAAFGTFFSCWTTDGARVVFRRLDSPYWVAADGSERGGILPKSTVNDMPSAPGPDSDSVLVVRIRPETAADIFLMSVSGAFDPKPLVATPAYEGGPQLSPDGRWLLYQADTSGQAEIYVQRYPALDRPWQVSEGGGVQARWRADGREIFYRSGQQVMAVTMDPSGGQPAFGKPTALFTDEYEFGYGASIPNYDVTRDGRFIMVRRGASGGRFRVITNWTEELQQILASGGVR
jgi:Tol biopolymer transport system component